MARCGCGGQTCNCAVQAGTGTTVTGTGTAANPYIISATSQSSTTVLDTPEIDMTITGTGTPADPYVISADVKISTDPNNCLTDGADGALFVPCPDGSETIVTAGPGTFVTGTGTVPDPYVVTATGVAMTLGCGLETGGGGELQANVSAWPYPCSQDTNASSVYCSPTTGNLQGDPRDLQNQISGSATETPNILVAPGGQRCLTVNLSFDMTNVCQPMFFYVAPVVAFRINNATPGAQFQATLEYVIDGASLGIQNVYEDANLNTGNHEFRAPGEPRVFGFSPGANHTFSFQACFTNFGSSSITFLTELLNVVMPYWTLN